MLNYPKSATLGFVPVDQSTVRNSCGKRAISVLATEVQLYILLNGSTIEEMNSFFGSKFFLLIVDPILKEQSKAVALFWLKGQIIS